MEELNDACEVAAAVTERCWHGGEYWRGPADPWLAGQMRCWRGEYIVLVCERSNVNRGTREAMNGRMYNKG